MRTSGSRTVAAKLGMDPGHGRTPESLRTILTPTVGVYLTDDVRDAVQIEPLLPAGSSSFARDLRVCLDATPRRVEHYAYLEWAEMPLTHWPDTGD